jgi:excisionase family DNA binding protein
VSTTQVAEALGISVSSVKRWVEDGILPAHKTAGGHRKLLMADVIQLARQNGLPLRDPAAPSSTSKVSRAREVDASALSEKLYGLLLHGDGDGARRIIRGVYAGGMPIETMGDSVIAPAMHRIGGDWEKGRIDVMHEHRASQLCEATLYELKAVLDARARRDPPVAVGGALEGDYSEIPSLLAQMVLLDVGWNAVNLGPNTPIASFQRAIVELKPQLIWLSASHAPSDATVWQKYTKFYKEAERAGVAVALGGRAITEPLRKQLPYTAFGDSLSHLAAFARTLLPPKRRPKRGRPAG